MSRTVIRGGYLLGPDGLIENAGVVVSGDRILQVGPNAALAPESGDSVIDVPDKLIAPGFVNGHTHLYGVLSHGITAAVPAGGFSSFLEDFWWPCVENRIDHDLVRATSAYGMAEMIDCGVTTFVDVLEAPNAIPHALEIERDVARQAGLRAILTFEACQRAGEKAAGLGLMENAGFVRAHNRSGASATGMMSIHTLFTCNPEYIKEAKRIAGELGCGIHMHLSESVFEPDWSLAHYGKRPVEVYDELNFLDETVLASQCVQVTSAELDILAKRGVRAVHMPLSNCEVGGGVAPVSDMLSRGMTVGLGSDGYINNFFEIMRGAFLIPKAHCQDTNVMPAEAVFRMATSLGARAAGLPDTGRLEPGCKADLITVDLDTPTPINRYNVYDQLVLFRNPQNVCDVMANGRFLKRDHRLLTVNAAETKAELSQCAKEFWAGIQEETQHV
jgi:cytosine/adenosine deaminase-related metal-dependent hydrolase